MKIFQKTKEFAEGKFLVVRRDGTIPHWPYLVLGARDPAAPVALRAYASACSALCLDPEYVRSINELAEDFERYRIEQGDGDPDAPPHRRDRLSIIDAMRGIPTVIAVTPDKGNIKK